MERAERKRLERVAGRPAVDLGPDGRGEVHVNGEAGGSRDRVPQHRGRGGGRVGGSGAGRGTNRYQRQPGAGEWRDPNEPETERHQEFDIDPNARYNIESLNAPHLPETQWSLTFSRQTQNVPYSWLYVLGQWMVRIGVIMGFFAYEVGGRHRYGHIQGVMRIRWPGDKHHAKVLSDYFADMFHVTATDQKHFTVKLLALGQTFHRMLG